MIALIQRVTEAQVRVDGAVVGDIGPGVLALVGVRPEDTAASGERLLSRLLQYRLFDDDDGKMNLSVQATGGGLLLVPQFTLAADTARGNRAGFSTAAPPAQAGVLFAALVALAQARHSPVASGVFGASMQVALINDGPVTFWLES